MVPGFLVALRPAFVEGKKGDRGMEVEEIRLGFVVGADGSGMQVYDAGHWRARCYFLFFYEMTLLCPFCFFRLCIFG